VKAYLDYKKVAAEEATKREEIKQKCRVAVRMLLAEREIVLGYFDRAFTERRRSLEQFSRLLRTAADDGDEHGLDVALAGIWGTQFQGATLHELLIAAVGASETESDEASDQFAAFDRTKPWHQIGVSMSSVMPLIIGSGV